MIRCVLPRKRLVIIESSAVDVIVRTVWLFDFYSHRSQKGAKEEDVAVECICYVRLGRYACHYHLHYNTELPQ